MSVNSKMTAIADAIRLKTGRADTLTLDEMASALNNIPTQTAKTITPGTISQTAINSGTFATGKITVKGDSNLKAENIVSGKSIFGVSGTYVGADTDIEDGLVTGTLQSYTNSRVNSIGSAAFYSNLSLRKVIFPNCITIHEQAFTSCANLSIASFPKCTIIKSGAFSSCYRLSNIYFPNCTSIEDQGFAQCKDLKSINFPECTTIGSQGFASGKSLSQISLPKCITIGAYAFEYGQALTSVYLPECRTLGSFIFKYCSNLTTIDCPKCTTINTNAFYSCSKLTSINFPACTMIASSAFVSCYNLSLASLPACTAISNGAFIRCSKLSTIYLAGSSVCKLQHSNAFSSTKITSTTGSIYVPLSLGWSYKNATNWTYFFNRIFSIEGEEIVEPPISFTIDGIAYEATIGSTWSDWIISDYNTADFKINGAAIVSADGSVQISGVIASDLIEENYDYATSAIGAFGDPITFSVMRDTYTALDGMTWADWVSSEYNSSDDYGNYRAISINMENNVVRYGDMGEIIVNEDWEAVTPHDLIIANMQYEVGIGDLDDY